MSIFNKPPGAPLTERPVARLDSSTAEMAMSIIGPGMRIIGDVESDGVIKVEGSIEGAIRGARQLLLGRSGVIKGDIKADDAIIGGRVLGAVVTSDRVEIQATASVEGDIHTKSIVVFEGGAINGSVRMAESRPASHTPSHGTPVLTGRGADED